MLWHQGREKVKEGEDGKEHSLRDTSTETSLNKNLTTCVPYASWLIMCESVTWKSRCNSSDICYQLLA